jgi:hypothetical protein
VWSRVSRVWSRLSPGFRKRFSNTCFDLVYFHSENQGDSNRTKDSVRSKTGFAHTNEYPSSVQSGRANDAAPVPVSRQKRPRLRHRGETSSLSMAHAETPRHRDRPVEYTPHARSYPAHAYPTQNVATALQSAHFGPAGSFVGFLGPGACTGTQIVTVFTGK